MSARKFKCPLYDLLGASDTITGGALDATAAPRINLRLVPPFVADTAALILDIRTKLAGQSSKQGDVDSLTLAQQTLVKAVAAQTASARKIARRAFKGNSPKLHDEFRVNQNSKTIGAILGDAGIISVSLKKADNAAPLAAKGWLPADTQKLDAALTAARDALKSETDAQNEELGQTAWLNKEANDLYDRLVDIQTAANLEWPADDPANVTLRAKFLLGVFPYSGSSGGATPPPPGPTPPAPTPPVP